jgi:hypothetical protein
MPNDVIRDPYSRTPNHTWYIVRRWENKFEVAARYPSLAEEILKFSVAKDHALDFMDYVDTDYADDQVPVYTLYHDRTPACPGGKQVCFMGADLVLYSIPLPYRELPIVRSAMAQHYGTWEGYTSAFDALGVLDAHNALLAAVVTNNMNGALQILQIPVGVELTKEQITGGTAIVRVNDGQQVEAKALVSSSPETYQLIQSLAAMAPQALGLNELAMGNLPFASIPAAMQVQATKAAVEFNSSGERAYVSLAEGVMTRTLRNIADFAEGERRVRMLGETGEQMVQSYDPDMLTHLDRVVVTISSPTERTVAGQEAKLQFLMQAQTPEHVRMINSILSTGSYEPVNETADEQEILLKWEREQLSDVNAPMPPVTPYDDHALHVDNAKKVLYIPVNRANPDVVSRVIAFITEHMGGAIAMADASSAPPEEPGPPQGAAPVEGQ